MSARHADNAAARFTGWYRAAALARLAILTVPGLLLLAVPLFAMHLVDQVLVNGALDALLVTGLGVAIAVATVIGLEIAAARAVVRIGRHLDLRLGPRLLKAAIASRAAGRQAADPRVDLGIIRDFLAGPSLSVLVRAAWSGVYLALTVLLHPILGVMSMLAALPLVALASRAAASPADTADDAGSAETSDASFAAVSRLLEAMGMTARHAVASGAAHRVPTPAVGVSATSSGVGPLIAALLVVGGSGSALVMVDELSLGVMVGILVLVLMALAPMPMLPWAWARALQAAQARRRLLESIAMEPSRPKAEIAELAGGVLSVSALDHTAENALLKDISFELGRGQTLVATGGTTRQRAILADLMLGLRRPDSGSVRWAGHELSDQDRVALAARAGFAPATSGLLAGSIRQNISRFGDAPLAAVREAAALAEIDGVIEALPDGYATSASDSAVDAGPGFAWRLGLARAVFGGASYVVIEVPEATLDGADLRRMIGRLRAANKTVILFAAHPLSAGMPCDRLQLDPDGTASYRASPRSPAEPAVASTESAGRAPAIRAVGPPPDDPRLLVLERFLARIRGNLTDASPPPAGTAVIGAPIAAAPTRSGDDSEPHRPVLHINPDWLARHVRALAADEPAGGPR